jgi:hypothetical protein
MTENKQPPIEDDAVKFLHWVDRSYNKERKGYVLRKVYANNPNLDNVKYWSIEELYEEFKRWFPKPQADRGSDAEAAG